jgi:hypothetical protein
MKKSAYYALADTAFFSPVFLNERNRSMLIDCAALIKKGVREDNKHVRYVNVMKFMKKKISFTLQLQTLRGSVLEDAIPNLKPSHSLKNINTKEVLEYVIPEIQLSW